MMHISLHPQKCDEETSACFSLSVVLYERTVHEIVKLCYNTMVKKRELAKKYEWRWFEQVNKNHCCVKQFSSMTFSSIEYCDALFAVVIII